MNGQRVSATEKRARWRAYFEQQLAGTDAEVSAATDAAMRALEHGAGVDAIVAAGLEGAKSYLTGIASPAAAGVGSSNGIAVPPPAPPAPPTPHPPSYPALGNVGSATSGIVSGLQPRLETYGRTYFTVWTFRLERTDSTGAPMTPIPVEMRGRRFQGAINNGDLVELRQKPHDSKLVRTRKVRNLTVGADVTAKGRRHPVLRFLAMLFMLAIFVVIFGGVLAAFANNGTIP